jgi:hypothetical protein
MKSLTIPAFGSITANSASDILQCIDMPAGSYFMGGRLAITTQLTNSGTLTVYAGATAISPAIAKSVSSTNLPNQLLASSGGSAVSLCSPIYFASADTIDLKIGGATLAAGAAKLDVFVYDTNYH